MLKKCANSTEVFDAGTRRAGCAPWCPVVPLWKSRSPWLYMFQMSGISPFLEMPLLRLITCIKIQSSKLPGPSRALAPALLTWHGQISSPCSNTYCVVLDILLILRCSLTSSYFCGFFHRLPIVQEGQPVISCTSQGDISHSDLEILETRLL